MSETIQVSLKGSAIWPERVMQEAKAHRWHAALLQNWWRWGGQAARLIARELAQWFAEAFASRDSCGRETQSTPRIRGRAMPHAKEEVAAFERSWTDIGATRKHAVCVADGPPAISREELAQDTER